MNARKDWIKQDNEGGPDCKRLQSKKALLEAKKTMDVVRKTGGRFIAPKKHFVDKDMWDEKVHGAPNGCWLQQGKKGVYDFEEYEDTAMEEGEHS